MFYLQSRYKVKKCHATLQYNSEFHYLYGKANDAPEDLILYAKIGCMRLKRVLLRMIIWDIIQQKK